MKTLRKTVFFSAMTLLLVLGSSLRAQTAEENRLLLIEKLTDYNVLASQAQGICQQIETFANNGNMNQLQNRINNLNNAMAEINLVKSVIARTTVPDRLIVAGLQDLCNGIDQDARIVASGLGRDLPTIGATAASLRERFNYNKTQCHEKRVALCCASY